MSRRVSKAEKIKILSEYRDEAESLKKLRYDNTQFEEWQRNTSTAIGRLFDPPHVQEFNSISYLSCVMDDEAHSIRYIGGLSSAIAKLNSMIKEVEDWDDDSEPEQISAKDEKLALTKLQLLMIRFPLVVKQLRLRHDERVTLDVKDEYDVQDLFLALLHLYFEDIRPEEWNPSYAGSSSRADFWLEDYGIAIEIKMTRRGLANKDAGQQLAIDKDYYRKRPDCKRLICFVYDPDGRIINPRGFEKDLRQDGPLKTDVYVVG